MSEACVLSSWRREAVHWAARNRLTREAGSTRKDGEAKIRTIVHQSSSPSSLARSRISQTPAAIRFRLLRFKDCIFCMVSLARSILSFGVGAWRGEEVVQRRRKYFSVSGTVSGGGSAKKWNRPPWTCPEGVQQHESRGSRRRICRVHEQVAERGKLFAFSPLLANLNGSILPQQWPEY